MRTSRIVIALEQVIIRCGAVLMTTHWDGVCLRESHIYRQDEFTRCESHPEFIGMTFAATPLMMQLLRRCQPRQHCSSAMSRRRENFPHCWPRRKKKKKKKFTGVSGVMWQQSDINATLQIHLPARGEERKVFQTRVKPQSVSEAFGGFSITRAIRWETISQLPARYLTLPLKWSRIKWNSIESPFFSYTMWHPRMMFFCVHSSQ